MKMLQDEVEAGVEEGKWVDLPHERSGLRGIVQCVTNCGSLVEGAAGWSDGVGGHMRGGAHVMTGDAFRWITWQGQTMVRQMWRVVPVARGYRSAHKVSQFVAG